MVHVASRCSPNVKECMMAVTYKQVNPMQHYENTWPLSRGSRVDGFNPEYGAPTLPTVENPPGNDG